MIVIYPEIIKSFFHIVLKFEEHIYQTGIFLRAVSPQSLRLRLSAAKNPDIADIQSRSIIPVILTIALLLSEDFDKLSSAVYLDYLTLMNKNYVLKNALGNEPPEILPPHKLIG